MAQKTTVTLICDSCGTEDEVSTQTLGSLTGEACPDCWDRIRLLTAAWRPIKRRNAAKKS